MRVLTGDRPTGPLHLGHYVGSLCNRVKLQTENEQYVMIADVQALTDHAEDPQKITSQVLEVAKDYFSVGLDPAQSTIFIQSGIPALPELTVYFLNLVTLGRLERNPTVKTEILQKGFSDAIPAGFFCYPVSQAADITAFQATCVPVGDDQLPMIEQTNEIVRKFNRIYNTDCLKEAKALLSHAPRLMGIDGKAKASKSLGNAIFLSDPAPIVREKVFRMFTDPDHLKVSDPGKVEGNVVFSYLDAFYANHDEVNALKAHYQKGGLGDTRLKTMLYECLEAFLEPIREKRAQYTDQTVQEILRQGTQNAAKLADQTLGEVRSAMGLAYF